MRGCGSARVAFTPVQVKILLPKRRSSKSGESDSERSSSSDLGIDTLPAQFTCDTETTLVADSSSSTNHKASSPMEVGRGSSTGHGVDSQALETDALDLVLVLKNFFISPNES